MNSTIARMKEAARSNPVNALRPLIGSIDNNTMREANKIVGIGGQSVGSVPSTRVATLTGCRPTFLQS